MTPRVLFIINPAAGGGLGMRRWQRFEGALARQSALPASVGPRVNSWTEGPDLWGKVFTSAPGEAERIAAGAALDHDLLVAVGGDGTVSQVCNGLMSVPKRRAGLAILPCGTGNDIARCAGLRRPQDAVRAMAEGTLQPLDVIDIVCTTGGRPRTRYALLFGGVGIIGPVLRHTTLLAKRLLGQSLAYRFSLIRALWTYSPVDMRVEVDGKVFAGPTLFLGISNGEDVGGGIKLAPGARTDDGLLNVNLVGHVGRWEGLREMRRLSRGQHTHHPKVHYFTGRSIRVDTVEPIEVAADGDLIGLTPASFEVNPGAIRLLRLA